MRPALADSREAIVDSPAALARVELDLFTFGGPDERLSEVSDAFAYLLGLTPGELNGRALRAFVHPEDVAVVSDSLAALTDKTRNATIECRFVQRDGRPVYLRWVARPLPTGALWRASGTDSAELVTLLRERRDLQTRLDLAIGQATAAMWDLNVLENRLNWEPQAAQILGVSPEALPANTSALAAAVHLDDSEAVRTALSELLVNGVIEIGLRIGQEPATRYLSLRGKVLDRDQNDKPVRAVGLLLDVTTEKAMQDQLLRMSVSDPLTGVPNRRAFDQSLRGEWRRCARTREAVSLIMVDIDDFKRFNDSFGHLVGDQALCVVARALATALQREGDLLSRYGGEEFAVVVPGADVAGALAVGQRLMNAVRAVAIRQAPGWKLSVSVGTASWHPDRELMKPPGLLARADEALYEAKAAGRNRMIAYEKSLAVRDSLQAAIATGLEEGQFELYYQPIIGLADGDVVGFEAMMRWNRPGHGVLAPDSFIPVADSTELVCDLGRWALRDAACQLAAWSHQDLHAGPLRVAVDVSARHAASPAIVTDVQAALAAAGIAANQLELELTETALRNDFGAGTELARVRALGVGVAINDFGTGHTSIAELAHLPADTLKLDRVFTASSDPRQHTLIELTIEAAHAFDLRVVAEGVQEEQTLHGFHDLHCDAVQGDLIARPMPAAQIPKWLAQWSTTPTAVRIAREVIIATPH
jgi:diguanylate cyclase (GGDEF)-like protein/PAS domain S-box-containing protein